MLLCECLTETFCTMLSKHDCIIQHFKVDNGPVICKPSPFSHGRPVLNDAVQSNEIRGHMFSV